MNCPYCGSDRPPVEGVCWECGERRGWPVPVWEGEPPQDQLWTDQDLNDTLEVPPL